MKHASALVAVLARNLTSASNKGNLLQGASTSLDSSAAAQSESADQEDGNLHARHAHYSFIMILILMTLFVLVTLSMTGAMLAFCRKKNAVFTHYDGVATTTPGEFGGRAGGTAASMDCSSELELGDLDADGEGMCGASDRGQCYYQLSDDESDNSDEETDDNNDDNISKREQKKMLKGKDDCRWNTNRTKDRKKELILEIQNDERHLNSENHIVHFTSNKSDHRNKLTTIFKLFKKSDGKPATKIASNTNGDIGFYNKSNLAIKSKTFPPAKSHGVNPKVQAGCNISCSSSSSNQGQKASSKENICPPKQICPPYNLPHQIDPAFSFYPSSRSKRGQLNGIGNANFKTGRRRKSNAPCVNPPHDHFRRNRNKQNERNCACSPNDGRNLRHYRQGQGHTYQARLYRRLQEQAARLNRDRLVTSQTTSDYWACAIDEKCRSHYQMRDLERYLGDSRGGSVCCRLHRAHSIHAIPQTGPESITDASSPHLMDDVDGSCSGGGGICGDGGGRGTTSISGSATRQRSKVRGCRTSSKCGITIVRVEHSLELSDEFGDVDTRDKHRIDPGSFNLEDFAPVQSKCIFGSVGDSGNLPDNKLVSGKAIKLFVPDTGCSNIHEFCQLSGEHSDTHSANVANVFGNFNSSRAVSRSCTDSEETENRDFSKSEKSSPHHEGACTNGKEQEIAKNFDDLYLLPDENLFPSCCETISNSGNLSLISQNRTSIPNTSSSSTSSMYYQHEPLDGSQVMHPLALSSPCNGSLFRDNQLLSECQSHSQIKPPLPHIDFLSASTSELPSALSDLLVKDSGNDILLLEEDWNSSSTRSGCFGDLQFGSLELFFKCNDESLKPTPVQLTTESERSLSSTPSKQLTIAQSSRAQATVTPPAINTSSTPPPLQIPPCQNTTSPLSLQPKPQAAVASPIKVNLFSPPQKQQSENKTTQSPLLSQTTEVQPSVRATPHLPQQVPLNQQAPQSVHEKSHQTVPCIVAIPPPPRSQRSHRQPRNSPRHKTNIALSSSPQKQLPTNLR
ncbi:hypothetical protein ElyMa_003009600 [Elysia marginata]|uniref:Uncharacterized protein n=1 Tax=Elysia marginata TaxID=1093978 RepID=A0AAV4IDU1_9GAST|nr:hypothetical protein ElyMa_003009600 [Elysia marginata]